MASCVRMVDTLDELGLWEQETQGLCTGLWLRQVRVQGRDGIGWFAQVDPSVLPTQDQKMGNVHEPERRRIPDIIKDSHHS